MADFLANFGGVIDVDDTARKIKFTLENKDSDTSRGSLKNEGAATVYLGWNKEAIDALDDTEEADKNFIVSGDSIRVPKYCSYVTAQTAAGSAKLQYVED